VSLRKRLADEKNLPAYIVFGNATLSEMARVMPRSKDEMLEIKGVGDKKFESYGELFLNEISQYVEGGTV
jgi:ATP-dependent DNA helicase RecQ